MDNILLSLAIDYTNKVALGFSEVQIDDTTGTVTIKLKDGSSASWTFPKPANGKDGLGIKSVNVELVTVDDKQEYHLIVTYSDDSTYDAGKFPEQIINISKEEGNALKKSAVDGGLFVPASAVEYSKDEKNIAKAGTDGGIFVPATDLTGYAKSEDVVAMQQKAEDKGKALIVGEDGKLILDAVGSDEAINKIYADGFASRNLCPFDSGKFNSSSWVKLDGTPATSSDYADWSIINLKKGTYTIKFGENQNVAGIQLGGDGIELISFASYTAKTFTLPNDGKIGIRIKGAGDVSYLLQIEEGEEATPYTPYSKSNVDLTTEISRKELELAELKMLGWTVPKECPIQNEVNGNQFIQKVCRVDLGSLDWGLSDEARYIFRNSLTEIDNIKAYEDIYTIPNAYIYEYIPFGYGPLSAADDLHFAISNTADHRLVVIDHRYNSVSSFKSAMQGKYLYYELATPITKQIDGNEVIEKDIVTAKVNNFVKPTSDAEILALSNGIYSINVDDTSLFPSRWGTLIVLKSGYVYGSMIFITTSQEYYFRNINNGAWRETAWQKLTTTATEHTISYTSTSGTTKSITVFGK